MRSWSLSSLATKLAFAIVLVLVPAVALLLQYAKLPHASPVVAAGIVTALLAAAVIGGFAVRRVLVGLRRASDALDHLRNGRLDAELGTTGNDDAGRVLQGIEALRTTMKAARDEDHARAGEQERALAELRARGERDRASATENGRARLALDTVSAAVLLADASGRVTYANAAVAELLRTRAAALRAKIAGFDPEQLLGVTLDVLCPGADFERIAKTDTKELAYADATFRVVASPVLDANGVRAGVVLQWFDRTQDVASEDEINFVVQAAVEGDLTQRIRADDKAGYFRVLVDGVNRLLASMAETVRTMQTAAGEVSSSATEIARGNQHLSERTEEQASSLEETASSMEEMTSTVKQNADNAQQANALVLAARTQAEKGGAVVERAVAAMREINSSSSRIAAIIDVIDEIAFQTNLLALNAAVEAARAGEQGRGFAVVASEVRNLASRSAEAAKEIKTLITDSVAKVDGGSRLVDQSGQMLVEIVAAVNKVASIFSEITLASREQSVGIEQVNQAVMSMDEVTQQNAALVEEAAAAASTLMDQAKAMHERMAYFDVTGGGASAAPIEITAANVADAIPAHLAWRRRLRAAIASRGTVDAATLGRDDCCALGKWLHGPARSHFGSLPSHSRCTQAHAQFHREAGRIAGTINDKQYREAARLLEPGTGFSVASDACVEAVRALQEDVSRRQAA